MTSTGLNTADGCAKESPPRATAAGGEVSILSIAFHNPTVTGRELVWRFRGAMQLGGVDFSYLGGMVSAIHDDRDVDQTVTAFDRALERLQTEGIV